MTLPVVPWVLSNSSKGSLLGLAQDLRVFLRDEPSVDVGALGCTLAGGDRRLGHRAVLLGRRADDFDAALEALELGAPAPNLIEGLAERAQEVVFAFPPHGAEWAGMGCELLDASEVFRQQILECQEALAPFVDWSLVDVLRGVEGAPGLERGDVAQPAIFAISIALARLLREHGVEPAAVLGHSIGEVAAAYVAGGLSLEDAARIIARWSQAEETLRDRGGMASVQLPPAELLPYLAGWSGQLGIGAYNGPSVTVVTGDSEPLEELIGELRSGGVRAQRVSIPLAAHSPHIDAIHDRLLSDLASVVPRSGTVPFYSTVTGGRLDTAELDAAYWAQSLREVVKFEQATRAVLAAGHRVLIEVSPHPVLTFGMRQTADAVGEGAVLSSMRREHAGPERFTACLAEAWVHGADVDWSVAFAGAERGVVELPRSGASVERDERDSLRERVRAASGSKRAAMVAELVRNQVAAALGVSVGDVSPTRPFKELGIDSASVVELAERLNQLLDVRLPPTAGFDHPTPAGLARRALDELLGVAAAVVDEPSPASFAVDEPIAIVGMGCRFPGDVTSPEDLWELVDAGRDAIGPFPEDRGWDLERLYDPDPDRIGTCYSRHAGFVYDAPEFDAEFFGISPREALGMDPQQRLLLQVAWEALEDAGIDPLSLRGSDTGVFAGMFPQEYGPRLYEADVSAGYSLTGMLTCVASGRVAYTLGFEGPAESIDTACSSALVAIHHASGALRRGECSLALAGGVTIMSTPGVVVEFARQRALAPDGRVKTFGAGADGTSFAEGAGLLVLERLADARRLGHHVLAVVRGTAVNQDGASNGLTAPNGPSQERVIRQALARAGLSAGDVDVVEAHGTGTTLGDPIEARALIATYGQARSNGPVHIGSLKSNIGHANAAAGVAGTIKMVQALRHERLPRSLHCEQPSPNVDWSAGDVKLLQEPVEWPAGERPRRAGVSAFGVSGTNAHLILEEAPREEKAVGEAPEGGTLEEPPRDEATSVRGDDAPTVGGALPFVVSAATDEALAAQAGRLASFVEERAPGLFEVASALATRRAQLVRRAVVVASDRAELVAQLRALERGELGAGTVRGSAGDPGTVAFLFSGQGSQWAGMGAGLYEAFPAFAEALDEVCAELDRHLERPLSEVMFAEPGSADAELLSNTRFTQTALFALEVALYRLVRSFGIEPDHLIGHSIGEFAAAHVAGVFSLADGCRLVAERARLMGALPEGGAMLAVEASESELVESLAGFEGRVALAAVNGPRAMVASGQREAIDELEALWRDRERRTTRLRVSHAFHSQLMEPMLAELRAVAAQIELADPAVPIVSNVTGEELSGEQARSPDYWVRHVRETVRFADGVRTLQRVGVTRFLELGPDGVLSALAAQTVADGGEAGSLFATALRGSSAPQRDALLTFLGAAHCHGLPVDWSPLLDGRGIGRVELPTYAFQRRRYWLETTSSAGSPAGAGLTGLEHPLLSTGQSLAGGGEWLFTGRLSLKTHPWLADHVVAGVVLLPGMAFLELALLAAWRVGAGDLEDLTLVAPLVLDGDGAVQVQVGVSAPDEDGSRPVNVYSRPEGGAADELSDADWTLHASGLLRDSASYSDRDDGLEELSSASWPPAGAEELDVELFYEQLADVGYEYGPAFQGLRRAFRRGDEWYAEVVLGEEQSSHATSFRAHPALGDAALHAVLLALLDRRGQDTPPEVPFSFSGVRLLSDGCTSLRVRVAIAEAGEAGDGTSVSLQALDEFGAPALAIETLELRPVDQAALKARARTPEGSLFAIDWTPLQLAAPNEGALRVALLDDGLGFDELQPERHADLSALERAVAAGAPVPDVVLAHAAVGADDTAATAHEAAARTLALLQTWLASEPLAEARLVLLTDGALAVSPDERPNLGQAALVGLMRSAASEEPGRLGIVDLDRDEDTPVALAAALASGEPELAIREGRVLAPRLARATVDDRDPAPPLDPDGTVLITGGTHGLGALVARHLAAEHGVSRLLLLSRRGADAEGVEELVDALAQLGCEARVAACDVADRSRLEAVLADVPERHPLTAVVHAAGLIADGTIASLDEERLRRVMAPKVDGALNLHELTAGLGLSQFVLFSSVAATLGVPGQGNYAAANAFLDALAQRRHADGLPATSLAWGMWERVTAMTAAEEVDFERWERAGISPLSDELGLSLLDTGRGSTRPLLVPVRLARGALRARAKAGTLPAILRGLFRGAEGKAGGGHGSLARRLEASPESEWQPIVLQFVLSHVAGVLKHGPDAVIDPQRAFKDLGFDSLSAIELRNRVSQGTGVTLPATLVFDHPTPAAVAELVRSKLAGSGPATQATRSRARSDEPIAIVGMSCRYPGGVRSPEDLWRLLHEGGNAIGEFPDDRGWDLERLYDPDPDHPGTVYTRHGGFLYDAGEFDPELFSISPREALAIDPQHRLSLEGAWEALEDAGIDPSRLRGSRTGVFAGVMYHDYGSGGVPAELEGYIGTGGSLLSGRLAYTFGFEGPAVSVDTACSSSLVALHLASQALRQGECDLALAGGVTVLATPYSFVIFSRQRGLAPDGRCKSFGAGADGTVWSEGAGLLVLQRLSDAQRAGHRVLGVIRGSAVNQDGASNGLTAPNGPSQERVIRDALASAGLSPADVDAVEGHGTGTALGDPIEAQALLATYGQERSNGPLRLGSMKSNIGHTQAAAGVAGVIKMVQALRHERLPRSLHCDEPSPHVDWSQGEVELLREPVEWPAGERPRRAGVSSFGVSGTNAHVILEEPPAAEPVAAGAGVSEPPAAESAPAGAADRSEPPVVALAVSAHSEAALAAQAERLRDWLAQRPQLAPADVGFSLATGRAQLERRAVVVGSSSDQLAAGLDALARGETSEDVAAGEVRGGGAVFVFPGQGSQWEGMALELLHAAPVFAESLRACGDALSRYVDWSLEEVLRGAEGAPSLERVDVVQPALFAVMVSLAALWRSFGVEPIAVVGHSQGEIAAACVAGGLSLDDAARVVALRSQAIADLLAGHGGMLAVAVAPAAARELIEGYGQRLSLAAVNGPASVVISGETGALEELLGRCEDEGVWARRIPVDYPSHSARVEDIRERLLEELTEIEPRSGAVPFFSTVDGETVDTAELDADYWYRNLRHPVLFNDAVETLIDSGAGAFVEVSPHPGLTVAMTAAVESRQAGDGVAVIESLRRGQGGLRRFAASLARAHVHGIAIDWRELYAGTGARRVDLPTYAFQRRRYWLKSTARAPDVGAAGLGAVDHPLLHATLPLAGERGTAFSGRVSLATHPWLADHAVLDRVLLPATAFAELLLAAGAELGCGGVEELTLEAPLVLTHDDEVALEVLVGDDDGGGRREVEVHSRTLTAAGTDGEAEAGAWVRHASGVVSDELLAPGPAASALATEAWPPPAAEPVDVAAMYDRLEDAGFAYGSAFQGVVAAWRRGDQTFCEVAVGEDVVADAASFAAHPALLDACLHASFDGAGPEGDDGGSVPLPFSLTGVRVHRSGASSLRAVVTVTDEGRAMAVAAVDEAGRAVLEIDSLALRPIDVARLGAAGPSAGDDLFRHEWVEVPLAATDGTARYAALGGGPDLLPEAPRHGDLDALRAAVEQGADVPDAVFLSMTDGLPDGAADGLVQNAAAGDGDLGGDVAAVTHERVSALLAFVQEWLKTESLGEARLVLVTCGAMRVSQGEQPDPSHAALWGLVRSAQSEHPGRFTLVDLGVSDDAAAVDWPALLATDEPQLAVRRGTAFALRLARLDGRKLLAAPDGTQAWHLDVSRSGTLENLALVPSERADAALAPDEVRIAVRASGLNFRDVLIALGRYPDDDPIGSEGAGVVLDVGEAVTDLAAGDRVMGLMPHAFGPAAVTERRLLARMPGGWSFAEAASVPVVFLTAYYGLRDLAGLQQGEKLLVHAGAGGVGMAAIQLARHLGAEVYATASPEKWGVLRELGLDDEQIASSRDLAFRDRFLAATDGEGVDVVLNALAGEAVDASLDLLPRGGRFLEMGKADRRDPDRIARERSGVEYRTYDVLRDAGPERVSTLLDELLALFETGVLRPLPVRAWDVRHAFEAFRHLGDGRSVGKVVLTVPRSLDPEGTVLITGGTGDLGARVARRLAQTLGVRRLLLVSRRGDDAPGAAELVEELRGLGADPRVCACDVTVRDELAALLQTVEAEHPLTAVVHTAGVLDDGLIELLTPEQVSRVLTPKVVAALLLHELTRDGDLAEFIVFSSDSGTVGVPGQANYAAANVFLDALAERRRAQGLPGTSLAWGLWSDATGMAGGLGDVDVARLTRLGVKAMTNELDLFDAARSAAEPVVVPTALDMPALRVAARDGTLPPLMREIVRARPRPDRTAAATLAQRLAGVPEDEREGAVLQVVREEAAVVLGYDSAEAIGAERKFKELGFDSLGGVELRNRLAEATGLRLPSTLVFDHPTPVATTAYLLTRLAPPAAPERDTDETELRRTLASISVEQLREAGLLDPLLRIAGSNGGAAGTADEPGALDDLDADELVRMARST